MNELTDIFIHTEGSEKVAYHGGQEIARMTSMGYERFLVSIFRWMREHGACPVWSVGEDGQILSAHEIERELTRMRGTPS